MSLVLQRHCGMMEAWEGFFFIWKIALCGNALQNWEIMILRPILRKGKKTALCGFINKQ